MSRRSGGNSKIGPGRRTCRLAPSERLRLAMTLFVSMIATSVLAENSPPTFVKITLGIGMIVVFSLGLAVVLVAVGLILVWTRSFLKPLGQDRPWLSWLPVASSLVIILIGVLMLGRILWAEGLLFGLHSPHPGG